LAQPWPAVAIDEHEAHQQEATSRCAAVVKFENLCVLTLESSLRDRSLSLKETAGHHLHIFIIGSRGNSKARQSTLPQ